MKKKKIIIITAAVLLTVAGGILVVNQVRKGSWEKQELIYYSMHSGGGMRGGSDSIKLSEYGDKALLTYSEADRYDQDPTVTEYLIDAAVLDEIKEIFLNEGMYKWDGKKFTNLFVADGETTAYDFMFSEDSLGFSSQIYPEPYKSKLAGLDEIIEKYSVDGEKLPGLVLSETSEGDRSLREPEDGQVKLGVSEYSQNQIVYWVSNGKAGEVSFDRTYSLTDEAGNVLSANTEKSEYPWTVYPGGDSEETIELESRLAPGKYTLTVGDLSCGFEIR